MNEMINNFIKNSIKTNNHSKGTIFRSPENTLKRSQRLIKKQTPNIFSKKDLSLKNKTDSKEKKNKFSLSTYLSNNNKEKSFDRITKKSPYLLKDNVYSKNSQSLKKEKNSFIYNVVSPLNQKIKLNLDLNNEDKHNSNNETFKTPKSSSIKLNNSILITPKNNNTNTYRQTLSPDLDNARVLNLLSGNNIHISINNLKLYNNKNFTNAKISNKSIKNVKAYSANSNQGIIRNYNEDRVSIILNIIKPSTNNGIEWPKCSFFAIYDGHGGCLCSDYLRDNLQGLITNSNFLPSNPIEAIYEGFRKAENEFIYNISLNQHKNQIIDKSGSCALIAFFVDDVCYIASVGDSRAVISKNGGSSFYALTVDHKPNQILENKRILENGGKVYQTPYFSKNFNSNQNNNNLFIGPHRVLPGRLSVSRAIGDSEAKLTQFGGKENVIIAVPDITSFKIDRDLDFIVLGCDGIFDELTDHEVIECVWLSLNESIRGKNIHLQCGIAVDLILKSSLLRKTLDNVTCVLIVFENFEKCFNNNSSNFTFSSINSNLSTFNTINTSNNIKNLNLDVCGKEDKTISINLKSNYKSEEKCKVSNSKEELTNIQNNANYSIFENIHKKSNVSLNENIPKKNDYSPLNKRSTKKVFNYENAAKLLREKNHKSVNISNSSYQLNSQNKDITKNKLNICEEFKNNQINRIQPSNAINYKRLDTLIKITKK